ncbi:MAG: patatin-like phospholipase family protein [Chitinispirillales bacterium]|nr:patatin-like phospholipase family protein [Chitinispirillales bacterium]
MPVFIFLSAITVVAEKKPLVLSLSGGGARGFAHIGVLKYFEECGIVPDTIVGASMGAIVASLYSCGYSANEIHQILKPLSNPNYVYSSASQNKYSKNKRFKSVFSIKLDDKFYPIWQGSLVSPLLLDNLIGEKILDSQIKSGGDFDKLSIPLRIVTTDVSEAKSVIHKNGDILQLVKASSAVPGVMIPVKIGSNWHIDGGLKANIPLLENTENEFTAVVDVTTKEDKKEKIYSIFDALTMSITVGMKEAEANNSHLADIIISPLAGMSIKNNDFYLLDSIVKLGYEEAKKTMEISKELNDYKNINEIPENKINDNIFVKNISIEGANNKKERYLHRVFDDYLNKEISIKKLNDITKFLNNREIFDEFYFTQTGDLLIAKVKEKEKLSFDIGIRFDNVNLTEIIIAPQYNDIFDCGISVTGKFQVGFLRRKIVGGILWDVPTKDKFNLSFSFDGHILSQRLISRQVDDTTDANKPVIYYSENDISKNGIDFVSRLGFTNNVSFLAGFYYDKYKKRESANSNIFFDFDAYKNKIEMFVAGIESDYRNDEYFPTTGGMQNLHFWMSDKLFGSNESFFSINGHNSFVIPVGGQIVIIPSINYAWANKRLPLMIKHNINGERYNEFISSSDIFKTVNFAGLEKINVFADNIFVSELCFRYQFICGLPFYALFYADYGNLLNYDDFGELKTDKSFFYDAPIGIEVELALQTFAGPVRFSWSRIVRGEFNENANINKKNVFKFSAGFDF